MKIWYTNSNNDKFRDITQKIREVSNQRSKQYNINTYIEIGKLRIVGKKEDLTNAFDATIGIGKYKLHATGNGNYTLYIA